MKSIKLIRLSAYFIFVLGVVIITIYTPRLNQRLQLNDRITDLMNTEEYLKKRIAMRNVFLKYNSPFVDEIDSFLYACIQYDLDCYLLPAISGVESGFGRALLPGSYNPFGWDGGYIYFNSWRHGFLTVAKGLKENYINQGLTTPELISPVYAPPSHTWASKVRYFMSVFEQEEARVTITVLRL